MTRLLLLALIVTSTSASAIVMRHDVDDSEYRVPATEAPALADLPGEGHGVLIAPQWIVTAAHAVSWQQAVTQVVLNGVARSVERVVVHPGFKPMDHALIDQALASGDATLVMIRNASSDDIALVKLAEPVTDVAPVALFTGRSPPGQRIKVLGKGATGLGLDGFGMHASHRTELRRMFNEVSSAHGRWLCYRFDQGAAALPLEGGSGNGDSGGPVFVEVGDAWRLAALTSWTVPHSDIRDFRLGRYGQISCNVRVGHYAQWLESTMGPRP